MNSKQTAFLNEYLLSGNGTAAYKKAYGIFDDKQAAANAARLLKQADIKQAVEEHQQAISQKMGVSVEDLVAELKKVAFSDLTRIVTWDTEQVTIKSSDEIDLADRATISEFTEMENKHGKRRAIRQHPKLEAINMLLKITGAYKADNQQKTQGINLTINESDLGKPQP